MKALGLILALAAGHDTEAEVRFLAVDAPRLELTLDDGAGVPRRLSLHAHAPSPRIRLGRRGGILRLSREGRDADGIPGLVTAVAAPIPARGGAFLAIVRGRGDRLAMRILPDPEEPGPPGAHRFVNLCERRLGLDLPGAREILPPGGDRQLHPAVKAGTYGQGRLLVADADGWRVAGNLRWLQPKDTNCLWLVMPEPSGADGIVFRSIEEGPGGGKARVADGGRSAASR